MRFCIWVSKPKPHHPAAGRGPSPMRLKQEPASEAKDEPALKPKPVFLVALFRDGPRPLTG